MWTLFVAAFACEPISAGDILAVPPPAVIVLGARPGHPTDLGRAARLVRGLSAAAPVTLALDAVPGDAQPVLDRYLAGELETDALADALAWEQRSPWPWPRYAPLVGAAVDGAKVVAAGVEPQAAPAYAEFPVPGTYTPLLRDSMGDHPMPLALESAYLRAAAWRDRRIASIASGAWSGDGYLVVVAHRAAVEGGVGVGWQMGVVTDKPVHTFVLAWADEPVCADADRVWRESLLEKIGL
jgi:hypothetical protein